MLMALQGCSNFAVGSERRTPKGTNTIPCLNHHRGVGSP